MFFLVLFVELILALQVVMFYSEVFTDVFKVRALRESRAVSRMLGEGVEKPADGHPGTCRRVQCGPLLFLRNPCSLRKRGVHRWWLSDSSQSTWSTSPNPLCSGAERDWRLAMHLPAASGTSQAHHRTLWVHADVSAALRYSPVPSKPASPSSW